MALQFQKTISVSLATLPVTVGVLLLLWVLFPAHAATLPASGLWPLLWPLGRPGLLALGLAAAMVAVYMMAELNNANVLLRTSSRMLSSVLALLLAVAVPLHLFQPALLLVLLVLLIDFPLFMSCQLPQPPLALLTGMLQACAAFVCPPLLWLVPVYWGLSLFMNALTLRTWLASVLGVLTPYVFYGGLALATHLSPCLSALLAGDGFPSFVRHLQAIPRAPHPLAEWAALPLQAWVLGGFLLLLFLTGAADFYRYRLRENFRTRLLFDVVVLHGVAVAVFFGVCPSLWLQLLSCFMVDTAILYGHFFASTYTRFSHYYNLFLLLLALGVAVVLVTAEAV